MKLVFNFTKENYIDFNMHYYDTSKIVQKNLLKSRIMGPVMFMVLPFVLPKVHDAPFIYWFSVFAITSLLWFIFLPKYSKSRFKKAVEKMLNEKDSSIFGQKELTLYDNYFVIEGEFQETKTELASIIDIQETEKSIYLYNSANTAIMVPLEAFENEAQKQEFLQIISSKVDLKNKQPQEKKKSIFDKMDI